jgi:hypothetical protein
MSDGRPEWNEDRASALVGKYALIGLTFVDQDENVISQVQRHGRILEADASRGIAVRLVAHGQHWDGEMYRLPPDLSAFVDAPPGEYRLRSTGEVVVDPDVTASWTIKSPPVEEDTPERRRARAAEALRFGFDTGES